ncbi:MULTISPECIES: D-glycero-beta-D-manno-heptose 1,7-bisphosphate 7-phosphatase [Halomonas]|uniref:D-glycero-beta-D-manno-heptose-1,7-bisphosphate 7-phosphatase n=1 Tax=Halomonas ventosae TaxID=229007 RepID=A0A4R6HFN0_9GAMM|nr:D-glycero-beta-D-manno-heptose 1,7-bisphosphate 7-phosphatase [Halomonas ventosae]TDO06655.1 D-alpha,beta-D-heptose 1,7-bisphosphate phosphatase [Halomonas ventosae]
MPLPDRLVILDRDGVINHDSDNYVKSLKEWTPYPSSITAIARLSRAGWTVAVATNQSGIARGYYDEEALKAIHARLHELVREAGGEIAHIAYCPHGPEDGCRCRKPLPGMLEEIRRALGMKNLESSWMVGDSQRDLKAGKIMGCRTVLVRTGKGLRTEQQSMEQQGKRLEGAKVFDDLATFVDWLLARGDSDEQSCPARQTAY